MKRYRNGIILILAFIFLSAAGCSSAKRVQAENPSLRFGLMPAVDSAPFLLAEKKGYFKELGLDVKLEMYNNAQDRQSALQTQSIDGAITDLVAVAANVGNGFDIKATTMTNGVFPLLSRKGSKDRKDIKAGMMEISVTNFLTDEWLGDKYNVEKVFINDIPARLSAISSGQIDMGIFPEPVASMGELGGLDKDIFEPADGYCPDVAVFTAKALKNKEEAIRLFHEAYNKAIEDINKNQQEARDILMEKIPNLKPGVRNLMALPKYTEASLPDGEYIDKIIDWTAKVTEKDLKVTGDDLVERKFIK